MAVALQIPTEPLPRCVTVEEYLAFEEKSKVRTEYLNGRVYCQGVPIDPDAEGIDETLWAMAGAMPDHCSVNVNIGGELRSRLKKTSCIVYISDIRIRIGSEGQYIYPDLSIACSNAQFDTRRKPYSLLNPIMIVEILSASTQKYDLNKKAQLCREKESIKEILFVSPDEVYVLHLSRHNDTTWTKTTYLSLSNSVIFPSLGCELPLEEIYLNVVFGKEEEE